MKKEYEKPVVEVIIFDYEVQAEGSNGSIDFGIGDWWA